MGLYWGVLLGLLRGILGVATMAHIEHKLGYNRTTSSRARTSSLYFGPRRDCVCPPHPTSFTPLVAALSLVEWVRGSGLKV